MLLSSDLWVLPPPLFSVVCHAYFAVVLFTIEIATHSTLQPLSLQQYPKIHYLSCRSSVIGAAYGTAKSSVGISTMGVLKPDLVMRAVIPVIFAGALAVYGLIVAVILAGNREYNNTIPAEVNTYSLSIVDKSNNDHGYSLKKSFTDLAAGLTVGLCGMASGKLFTQTSVTFAHAM